jgi:hypothetical protein
VDERVFCHQAAGDVHSRGGRSRPNQACVESCDDCIHQPIERRRREAAAYVRAILDLLGSDQDAWADNLHYDEADPAESLETFGVLRRADLRLVERASPEDLQRVGVHAERGEESVEHLRKLYAGHDLLHLQQIARLRRAVSAS